MFTFIDLFAGIGGFRKAGENIDGICVFSSEIDKYARLTYEANFGDIPAGDIIEINPENIPDHDVLCGGFPCQPFSQAGLKKGFLDTRGTLFFNIAEILRVKKPSLVFLENVRGILSHDGGRTIKTIRSVLEDLGYLVTIDVVSAINWVPQNRRRVFIVGSLKKTPKIITSSTKEAIKLNTIIQPNVEGYNIGQGTWDALKRIKQQNIAKGVGFKYSMITFPIEDGAYTRTISARYHKDGSECLVETAGNTPRKLTETEMLQLFGWEPNDFEVKVSKTQFYKQMGNSVVIPAIQETFKELIDLL